LRKRDAALAWLWPRDFSSAWKPSDKGLAFGEASIRKTTAGERR